MATARTSSRTPGQMFGLVFGVVYVLVGLLGFVNDPILGIFNVNAVHNIVHLVIGGALLYGSTSPALAKTINLVVGVAYALVALLGFLNVEFLIDLIDAKGDGGTADDFLHLATAILAIYFGTAGGTVVRPAAPAA